MTEKLLISTAYFPPVQYFSIIADTEKLEIEKEENYIKQTYRNRCLILSANGVLALSVPIKRGSVHKTKTKDIEIDYTKRWQSVHLRAISSAYRSSAYYDFYYEMVEKIIAYNHRFLLDLNNDALTQLLKMLKIKLDITYKSCFEPVTNEHYDYRYRINPKKGQSNIDYSAKKYFQLFPQESGFIPNLSIIDLLFNTGPDANSFL